MVLATGATATMTYAAYCSWINSPEGQNAIRQGAKVIQNGINWIGDRARGAWNWATSFFAHNVNQNIPSKLKKSDDYVDISKFNNRNSPRDPKGGRGILGPSGYYLSKDRDQHKGYWKLMDKNGRRIATLAADGKILGK